MRGALHEAFLQVDSEILTRCRAEDGRDGTTAVAMLRIGQRRPFASVRCYWGHALHAALGCLQGLGALLCCGLCGSALTGRCGLATSVLYSPSLCTGYDINPRDALRALGKWCSEAEILVGGSGHAAHVQNSLFDKGTHGPTPAWACLSLPDLFTCKLETCQCSQACSNVILSLSGTLQVRRQPEYRVLLTYHHGSSTARCTAPKPISQQYPTAAATVRRPGVAHGPLRGQPCRAGSTRGTSTNPGSQA